MSRHISGRRPARRSLFVAAALAALVAGGSPATAMAEDVGGPGMVAFSSSQCASAKLCLWSGTAYTGSVFSTSASSADVAGLTSAGSVWNRRSVAVKVYSGTGGSGTWTCIASGQQSASTTLKARSVKALTTPTC